VSILWSYVVYNAESSKVCVLVPEEAKKPEVEELDQYVEDCWFRAHQVFLKAESVAPKGRDDTHTTTTTTKAIRTHGLLLTHLQIALTPIRMGVSTRENDASQKRGGGGG
jgi:hypothetical protein